MPSFDVESTVNLQEVDNAVNQTAKEISTRYDFRGSKSSINLNKTSNTIDLIADDDYKIKAVQDIFQSKAFKRGISLQSLKMGKIEEVGGSLKKCIVTLVMGIETEKAKEIVKTIKETKMKVQVQIQDEKVRVTGKKRDDLQEAIAFLKAQDFGIPLQFGNYRD